MSLLASSDPRQADLALLREYASSHNASAFALIVDRHAPAVYTTAMRIVGESSLAQDAVQETFFRLMRHAAEVTESLAGWLHRTATRLAVDALRSESCRKRREVLYVASCRREATTWSELSPHVDQALAELSPADRALLVEHYLLGRTQLEMAQQAQVSPATLSRRVSKACDELRERLQRKGVVASAGVIATLLRDISRRPLPGPLHGELAKMTLVSGAMRAGVRRYTPNWPWRSARPIDVEGLVTRLLIVAATTGAMLLSFHYFNAVHAKFPLGWPSPSTRVDAYCR